MEVLSHDELLGAVGGDLEVGARCFAVDCLERQNLTDKHGEAQLTSTGWSGQKPVITFFGMGGMAPEADLRRSRSPEIQVHSARCAARAIASGEYDEIPKLV